MQPNGQPQDNSAVLAAIENLKKDITSEFEQRLTDQQAAFDERFQPVDEMSQILREARENQIKAQQQQAPQSQQGWQPKSWDEIPQMIDTRAQEIAKKTLEDRDRAENQRIQSQSREEQELEAQIDRQLSELERSGYLPPVSNPNDYNDPGVATRRELLAAASHMGTPELDKVAGTLAEMHKNNIAFDASTKSYVNVAGTLTPLPGKFAPVGNGSQNSPSASSGPSYRDIHEARDLDSVMALAEQRGYGPLPAQTPDDRANAFFGN